MIVCSLIVAPWLVGPALAPSVLPESRPPRVDAEPCLRSDTQTSQGGLRMIKRVVFVAGVTAGYLFGTPSGRRQLEKMKVWAVDVWHDPRVQEYVQEYEAQAAAFAKKQGAARVGEGRRLGQERGVVVDHEVPDGRRVADRRRALVDADDANPGQR